MYYIHVYIAIHMYVCLCLSGWDHLSSFLLVLFSYSVLCTCISMYKCTCKTGWCHTGPVYISPSLLMRAIRLKPWDHCGHFCMEAHTLSVLQGPPACLAPLCIRSHVCLLQVENLLLTSGGSIKLCDFGSATTQHITPDHSWSATQRGLADDEVNIAMNYSYIARATLHNPAHMTANISLAFAKSCH